jgi:phosphate-selective porin
MGKTFIVGTVLLLFFSCKGDKAKDVTQDTSAFDISTEKWPEKSKVNPKASIVLKNWPEFNALETSFDALYTVANTEDLSLVLEDLIEKQKLLADSEYPEEFDKPQIRSRQKVFQTFILKTKNDLEYRIDVQQSVLEIINAHNALLNQFNVIVNNTLDIKTLLDED